MAVNFKCVSTERLESFSITGSCCQVISLQLLPASLPILWFYFLLSVKGNLFITTFWPWQREMTHSRLATLLNTFVFNSGVKDGVAFVPISTEMWHCLAPCQYIFPPAEIVFYDLHIKTHNQLSHVWLFAAPWTAARQASLSITNSQSSLKLLPSNHLIIPGDAIQPSHPLSSPSPPAFSLSQHQGLSHNNKPQFIFLCRIIQRTGLDHKA